MRYRGLILMIPLLLLAARAFAKEDSIKIITVYRDDFTRESLKPRVTIMNTDSVPLHVYKTTKYADNVKSWYMEATERLYDAYILRAELKGYETTYETISIQKEDRKRKVKELSGLLMQRSVTQLKEVAVEASKVLMVYKGDTIIYDATAFNLADGSMLDGLIRALPGATIENGKISVNGQHVSRLLINGRDFFRGDAKIALENLPAYYVQRIKSYHEISAERRMQEGDSVRVDPMKDALVMLNLNATWQRDGQQMQRLHMEHRIETSFACLLCGIRVIQDSISLETSITLMIRGTPIKKDDGATRRYPKE